MRRSSREVPQSWLNLGDLMHWKLPGSSVHGIFPAIVLEWIGISFSSGSFQPRDRTWVSHIVDRRFTLWATREVLEICKGGLKSKLVKSGYRVDKGVFTYWKFSETLYHPEQVLTFSRRNLRTEGPQSSGISIRSPVLLVQFWSSQWW